MKLKLCALCLLFAVTFIIPAPADAWMQCIRFKEQSCVTLCNNIYESCLNDVLLSQDENGTWCDSELSRCLSGCPTVQQCWIVYGHTMPADAGEFWREPARQPGR